MRTLDIFSEERKKDMLAAYSLSADYNYTQREIAEILNYSLGTVNGWIKDIQSKLYQKSVRDQLFMNQSYTTDVINKFIQKIDQEC
ncbi:hypothetical protein ACW9QW_004176 [Acinetobacter baumannii]